MDRIHPTSKIVFAFLSVFFALVSSNAWAEEVTLQNDSLSAGDNGSIQIGFVGGESAAAWLTSPCDGNIVAVQVFWRSLLGGEPQSLEDSITIFQSGAFPAPGAQLALLEGPVMTDGVINEFRFLDENQTIPLLVPITQGQTFVVSFRFFNTPPPLGPSVVTDTNGCQSGKNTIFAIPGGWLNSCLLGVTGDFVIRAVVDCNPTQACCFSQESCLDLSVEDCGVAEGFSQGIGSDCDSTVCFPTGACCNTDGGCDNDVDPLVCSASSGLYQGDLSDCDDVTCPAPEGACCLSNDNCLELEQQDCLVIPGSSWAGELTLCADACVYGDVDGNGEADLDDLMCMLDGLSGAFVCPNVTFDDLDIAPCGGDGDVNLYDLLAMLDTLAGSPPCM